MFSTGRKILSFYTEPLIDTDLNNFWDIAQKNLLKCSFEKFYNFEINATVNFFLNRIYNHRISSFFTHINLTEFD